MIFHEVNAMKISCVLEHNGPDSLLYAVELPGAFSRGATPEEALVKMAGECAAWCRWADLAMPDFQIGITQDRESELNIRDADSDVIFDCERTPLTMEEYLGLKSLVIKSAEDFQQLYDSVPDKFISKRESRRTFYGPVPRTAREMYEHTKNVNEYYFWEIGVETDNDGSIAECRIRGFEKLEQVPCFLEKGTVIGSNGEEWSLRKMLRRFLWHDRIHAKAMYRMACRTFGPDAVPDVFRFEIA